MKHIKDSFKFFIIFIFFSNSIASEYPNRILFVGNSYLYYNDSIHNHVNELGSTLIVDELLRFGLIKTE